MIYRDVVLLKYIFIFVNKFCRFFFFLFSLYVNFYSLFVLLRLVYEYMENNKMIQQMKRVLFFFLVS